MGNAQQTRQSSPVEPEDLFWTNGARHKETKTNRTQTLEEFKQDLARKHEKRRELIAQKKFEMDQLREDNARLLKENELLRRNVGSDVQETVTKNVELKTTLTKLQKDLDELKEQSEQFERERKDYKEHVKALKDVIGVSKQMLQIREVQLKDLRFKVQHIETTLNERGTTDLAKDLQAEYEKQLQNIKNLRIYYEERQRADRKEKDELKRLLNDTKKELEDLTLKHKELEEEHKKIGEENSKKYDEIKNLESSLGLTKAECRQYQSELSVINQLFSQILLGFKNGSEIDVDKLIVLLEENHNILQDIASNEESNQVSALPKVLLDLVNEVRKQKEDTLEESDSSSQRHSALEIAENLPKVWKVLIELLSHQTARSAEEAVENPCYKTVQTPKGPHLVLSVSQTFIRLKDLILEKKSLERETGRLKHLNTHLECRLQEQEKRLESVSHELTETWHVVGKLQKKHQVLHTQEKILRYELAQKRKLLTELKEELEYSREMWTEARAKNAKTAKEWEQLRSEFAERKSLQELGNSTESGYSDDKESSDDEFVDSKERRLSRLEKNCKQLVDKVTATTSRSVGIEERLDKLHEVYGGEEKKEEEE